MFLLLSTFKFSSHLKIDLAPALVCPGRQLHVTRHRRELAQDVVMYLWHTGTINTHITGGRPEVYLDVPLKHCSHHWYTLVQSMDRSHSASVPYCAIVFAICSIVPLSTISCAVNYIMYITYVHVHQNVLQRTNFCGGVDMQTFPHGNGLPM